MMEKQRVPMLRFPHFEGEWKEKKLNDISSVNPSCKNLPDEFVYIDLESVKEGILLKENRITREDSPSRAQRILLKEDILFQTVRPYQKNNYYFTKDGQYVASTGYAQIRAFSDSKFLYHSLHLETFVKKVLIRCTGTSYPAINSSDLAKIKLLIPTLPEQQKIASFFTSIDKKIELLKKKHSLLEQYKKGVMQKIFAQEIRFKDENGKKYPDWEEKKLGEVSLKKSSNISANTITDNNGDYLIYGAAGVLKSVDFYNEEDRYISIVKDGAGVGRVLRCESKTSVLGTLDIIKNKKSNLDFLFYLLLQVRFYKYITGSTIPHIYYKDYSKEKVTIPCIQEQTKIANFLSAIDKKIEKVQLQIDKAEEWKKGLLGRMFC